MERKKPVWKSAKTKNGRYRRELFRNVLNFDSMAQYRIHNRRHNGKTNPHLFFRNYFRSVKRGEHVLFREFSFISATPYNRLCVLKNILNVYLPMIFGLEMLPAEEYHSLLKMLWPDFPFEVVAKVFESIQPGNRENGVSFLEFIPAFRKTFCLVCLDDFTYDETEFYLKLLDEEKTYAEIASEEPLGCEKSNDIMPELAGGVFIKPKLENESKSIVSLESACSSSHGATELRELSLEESVSDEKQQTSGAVGQLVPVFSGSQNPSESKHAEKMEYQMRL